MTAAASHVLDPARVEMILEERARALAGRREGDARPRGDALAAATATAGAQRFALPLSVLAGAISARPLIALPVGDDAVIGAIYERGEIWIVYSLAAVAGGAKPEDGARIIFLLRRDVRRAALAAEAGGEVVSLPRSEQTALGVGGREKAASIARSATSDGLMLVDEDALWKRLEIARRSTR